MIPGKMIDTTMGKLGPFGQYTADNITDEIAEQILENYPGYRKFFKPEQPKVKVEVKSKKKKVVVPVYPKYKSKLTCAVIIPTRGDREKLLDHGLKLLNAQTVMPDDVIIVDHKPKGKVKDLTARYRKGYELAKKYDVVICWEDDDYYHPTYIETVMKLWEKNRGLELIGTTTSTYYHIFDNKYDVSKTPRHSSMMSTSIKGGLDIDWPSDSTVFLDLKLWKQMKGQLFDFGKLATGIKHAIGVCGGKGHSGSICKDADDNGSFLKTLVDPHSFEFYRNYDKNR